MKRAIVALPLLCLVLGISIYLLRRTGPAGMPSPPNDPPTATAPPSPLSGKPSESGKRPEALSENGTGAIRFLVTLRGRPCTDAQITVLQPATRKTEKFKPQADGTQHLYGLPPGEYSVGIEHEDAIPYSAHSVLVGPGQTVQLIVDLKPGGRITGRITDPAGQPIAECPVFLLDPESSVALAGSRVVSDKDGRYVMKNIPPGATGLRFRHTKYKPLDRPGLYFRNASDEYQIDVVLQPGATFSGRVIDESGNPIPGARLDATDGETAGIAKSAADGTFTITGLNGLPANISAEKAGYGKVILRRIPADSVDIVFRLLKAGTVAGSLRIDAIPRQTQVTLSCYDEALRQVVPFETQFFALDPPGDFAIANVPPGTYWVDVIVEGYETLDRPQVVVTSGQTAGPAIVSLRKRK